MSIRDKTAVYMVSITIAGGLGAGCAHTSISPRVVGPVTGAAAGGAVGAAAAGRKGARNGAIVGGVLGLVFGDYLESQRQAAASQQEERRHQLNYLRQWNNRQADVNNQLASQIDNYRKRTARLRSEYGIDMSSRDQLRREIQYAQQNARVDLVNLTELRTKINNELSKIDPNDLRLRGLRSEWEQAASTVQESIERLNSILEIRI